ncbi:sigma 54-interacting transcriptional regulator [Aquaticitalea lipolytica]|uniref:sigma 54-interacting transcriptional regulator n=1 Tax=Aquaticitalea lipolytica TaxID=1247562 RepID=UPI0024B9E443|nr:sigma 54-interacting transcriptional regulator [Aquaticitalea lipolytica]
MIKKTILIVDDTYENLYLLRVILEEVGYHVIEANDGSEGLKKLYENSNVDLIISDILMPVMDGFMFCQACKEEKLFKNIPFVFYTSTYTERLDEDFALKLGAAKYLRKPIDHDEVISTVKNILGKESKPTKHVKKGDITNEDVLKLYSERLINKLEQKSLDLEKEVAIRKKAEKLLIQKNEVLDLIAHNTPLKKVFDHIILSYESNYPDYYASISLLHEDGIHLDLVSAPTMPESFNLAVKRGVISEKAGSCGTAAYTKKLVIVSDISKDELWVDYKDVALKHNLKSCWSMPILSKSNDVLGTFAIYSESINTPSSEEIEDLRYTVNLALVAIEKAKIVAEVKKRDEAYKSLVNQASDAIILYSFEGDIFEFNEVAYTILGYTKKEFSKLKIQNIIQGDIIISPERYEKILKGKPVIFERQLIKKNGDLIDAELSAKLQNDDKILGIVRDITERKKAELKLQESEKSLLLAQKLAKIGSFNLNLKTRVAKTSSSFNEIVGIEPNIELTADDWWSITHPEDVPLNKKAFKKNLKTGEKLDLEYRILTKNTKELKWIHGLGEIIYTNGEPTNFIGTIQDITEGKNNEIALKTAKEFTDKLIMSMQEGLLIVDLSGKIIMVNNSLSEILGYTKEEIIGLDLPYPFAKMEDLELMLEIKDEVASGETKSFQLEFYKKNGEKFLASFLSGNILNDNGEVIALFGTIKDITEEDKAKRILEETASKSILKKKVIMELSGLVGSDYDESIQRITALSAVTLNVARVGIWKFIDDRTGIICEKLHVLKTGKYESGVVLNRNDNPNYFDALAENQTINVEHAVTNNITKGFAKDYLIPFGITSMLDVFIQGDQEPYGVICFEHIGEPRAWTEDDQEFASTIASIVSLMVESVQRKEAENELVTANEKLLNVNTELNKLKKELEEQNVYLREEIDLVFNYEEMVYGSAAFSNVLTDVELVAATDATVLLLGESGTGKELLARAIHNTSPRKNKPLIKVNCAVIPKELIESELFGHKKGSFTGAISDKLGKFKLADGGTLFLDEIGELPIDMQPKLLRAIQESEIEQIGSTETQKVDIRIIAATNRNLKEEVEEKRFRSDLFFRLNVFPIVVPPLRDRAEDIPILIEHFVDKFSKAYNKDIKFISEETKRNMQEYSWPGNIRELENLIERAVILSQDKTLVLPNFETGSEEKLISSTVLTLDEAQRLHIIKILKKCNWKIDGSDGASQLLEIKPSTLRDRMKKLGIKKPN